MKILMTEPMTVLEDQHIATLVPEDFTLVHQDLFPSLFVQGGFFDCSALKMTKYKEK